MDVSNCRAKFLKISVMMSYFEFSIFRWYLEISENEIDEYSEVISAPKTPLFNLIWEFVCPSHNASITNLG